MNSNFDFLKNIDNELYKTIQDAQKLFRDEYFSPCVVQLRVFGEKMARKIYPFEPNSSFDEILNNLKDKASTEAEKELINDLFFIKQQGNNCAHGKNISATDALKVIEHAFEAAISYAYYKTKDEKINKLTFDTNLLILTDKQQKTLADKYVELAQEQKENLLKEKQNEFTQKTTKTSKINPKKEKIQQKIKQAKKNLKEKINKPKQAKTKKSKKINKKAQKRNITTVLFYIFIIISLILIFKMMCLY